MFGRKWSADSYVYVEQRGKKGVTRHVSDVIPKLLIQTAHTVKLQGVFNLKQLKHLLRALVCTFHSIILIQTVNLLTDMGLTARKPHKNCVFPNVQTLQINNTRQKCIKNDMKWKTLMWCTRKTQLWRVYMHRFDTDWPANNWQRYFVRNVTLENRPSTKLLAVFKTRNTGESVQTSPYIRRNRCKLTDGQQIEHVGGQFDVDFDAKAEKITKTYLLDRRFVANWREIYPRCNPFLRSYTPYSIARWNDDHRTVCGPFIHERAPQKP